MTRIHGQSDLGVILAWHDLEPPPSFGCVEFGGQLDAAGVGRKVLVTTHNYHVDGWKSVVLPGCTSRDTAIEIAKRHMQGCERVIVLDSMVMPDLNPDPVPAAPRAPAKSDIAVIVTAHNSAAFLDECLKSVFSQNLRPQRVAVVDDCSTDDTLKVARSHERNGATVVKTPKNLGMCGARMFGLAGVDSPVVMFFDADDVMPPGYLSTMRGELGSNGFVYPGRDLFGEVNPHWPKLWPAPPADRAKLWQQNYCPSPSLMWRHVFGQAGGWQVCNPEGTLPDWNLFLRMSAIAPFQRSAMNCRVRKHGGNFSSQKWARPLVEVYGDTRVHAATLTIGMVYSGRVPGLQRKWLRSVAQTLKAAGKTAELLILDDSANGFDVSLVCRRPEFTVTHRRLHGSDFTDRRKNPPLVSQFLAGACNDLLRCATGDVLWIIEDDIIVPRNACADLLKQLLAGEEGATPAVCGAYHSRHDPRRFVLSSVAGEAVKPWSDLPLSAEPVQLTGTGCLMILRDLVQGMAFRPQWHLGAVCSNAHDWTFSSDLFERGTPVMVVPSVVCPHHTNAREFV
jgi:glycosyltransferase involved in cell wall biosynthesis